MLQLVRIRNIQIECIKEYANMNYEHIYKPGEPGHPTFLVLHGTGGTEKDLVPLVNYIDSKAGI